MRFPVSSLSLPSPTASTLPFCGFSFAVSGRTSPEAVVVSSSTALTIRRSPSGLSFIGRSLRWDARRRHWHSPNESAKRYPLYRVGRRLRESSQRSSTPNLPSRSTPSRSAVPVDEVLVGGRALVGEVRLDSRRESASTWLVTMPAARHRSATTKKLNV